MATDCSAKEPPSGVKCDRRPVVGLGNIEQLITDVACSDAAPAQRRSMIRDIFAGFWRMTYTVDAELILRVAEDNESPIGIDHIDDITWEMAEEHGIDMVLSALSAYVESYPYLQDLQAALRASNPHGRFIPIETPDV